MINTAETKLVTALRSGKYDQAYGMLRDTSPLIHQTGGPAYCCLGVACDIFKPDAWQNGSYIFPLEYDETDQMEDNVGGEEAVLPAEVSRWLGWNSTDGHFVLPIDPEDDYDDRGTRFCLLELNDNDRMTFSQIADVIAYGLVDRFDTRVLSLVDVKSS